MDSDSVDIMLNQRGSVMKNKCTIHFSLLVSEFFSNETQDK